MASIEWETPQDFFDALNAEFHFKLDAAASSENAKCRKYFSLQHDSRKLAWYEYGSVWLNPPYTREIDTWIARAYDSAQDGAIVVCLLQGRSSDTKWWHDYVMKSKEIWFVKGRLRFDDQKGSAPFPSAIIVFKKKTGLRVLKSVDVIGGVL